MPITSPSAAVNMGSTVRRGCTVSLAATASLLLLGTSPVAVPAGAALSLSVAGPERIPAGVRAKLAIEVSLSNPGSAAQYVSPAMGELGCHLQVWARPSGTRRHGTGLLGLQGREGGFSIEDLFMLLPGRSVRQRLEMEYAPLFEGEGSLELWGTYDCRRVAAVVPRGFADYLESEHLRIPVQGHPLSLRIGTSDAIPPDEDAQLEVHLHLRNNALDPIRVPPAMGLIASSLEIFARPVGSKVPPRLLRASISIYNGYLLDDLFKLMPQRELENTVSVRYRPLFKGEGAIEIWAKYDCGQMARGSPLAFSGSVTSDPIIVGVRRQEVKRY